VPLEVAVEKFLQDLKVNNRAEARVLVYRHISRVPGADVPGAFASKLGRGEVKAWPRGRISFPSHKLSLLGHYLVLYGHR
jgi:hypothetical protein